MNIFTKTFIAMFLLVEAVSAADQPITWNNPGRNQAHYDQQQSNHRGWHGWHGGGGWGGGWGGRGYHSSTAYEGARRGEAALVAAEGQFLRGLGEFYQRRESAIDHRIDNWNKYVHTRWRVRDTYKERVRKDHDWLSKKEKQLDAAERRYELQKRESELRERGVLPPKPENAGKIKYGDKWFTLKEFKDSKEYDVMIFLRELKQLDITRRKIAKEMQDKEDLKYLAFYRGMSFVQQERFKKMPSEDKLMSFYHFAYPNKYHEFLEKKNDAKFYNNRPYLLPKAGENGLPKNPLK
jgi:hypothetical protein